MNTSPIRYRTTQPLPWWWLPLGVAVVVALAVGPFLTPEDPDAWVSWIMLLPMAVVWWAFSRMDVVVTTTELRFGFPLYARRCRLLDLAVGEVEKIPWIAGLGIHSLGRRWVYNARLGQGLALTWTKPSGRTVRYLVGSPQPEALRQALLDAGVSPRTFRVANR